MTAALYPQSSGPDGLERLSAAWAKPRRFGFFKEVNNTHIGVLYIANGLSLLSRCRRHCGTVLDLPKFSDPNPRNDVLSAKGVAWGWSGRSSGEGAPER